MKISSSLLLMMLTQYSLRVEAHSSCYFDLVNVSSNLSNLDLNYCSAEFGCYECEGGERREDVGGGGREEEFYCYYICL